MTRKPIASFIFSRIALHTLLLIAAAIFLIPVILMITTSLKGEGEALTNISLIPHSFRWQNYVDVLNRTEVPRMVLNSLVVTTVSTLTVMFLASLAAYAFSRLRFLGKEFFYILLVLGLILVPATLIVPLFRLVRTFNILNTYWALIGPYTALGLPFSVMILRNYFDTIPHELHESAVIDGASAFCIYRRIYLPLGRPALATVAIFQALFAWNEMFMALIFMTKEHMRTAPLAWITYQGRYFIQLERAFAVLVIITVPVLVLYLLMQRQFIKGLTAGAVKA